MSSTDKVLRLYDKLYANNFKWVKVLKRSKVIENGDKLVKCINTFITHPDYFIDFITPKKSEFRLFFAQRIVLRECMRNRETFVTATRGFSKTFLSMLSAYLNCMFSPGYKHFVSGATVNQAEALTKQTVLNDLWVKFPILKNEMRKVGNRAPYVIGSECTFRFTNKSILDVVGAHPRGRRFNGGTFEEIIEQDKTRVNEQLIPMMNGFRTDAFQRINPTEPQSKKIFVTTAGHVGTFAYDFCLSVLCKSIVDPDKYSCIGFSFVVPVMHGRLDENTMVEILASGTYSRESVDREYRSRWVGSKAGKAFSPAIITKLRKVVKAEKKAQNNNAENAFYAISADMAKDGSAATAVVIHKIVPQEYQFYHQQVNLFTIDSTDYQYISDTLKRTVRDYNADILIYDANGIGAAIRDWLNKDMVSQDGSEFLEGLWIINPPDKAKKDLIKRPHKEICYEIKSGGLAGERIHKLFFSRLSSGTIRFLIKSSEAFGLFSKNKNFLDGSAKFKELKMRPYRYMDLMEQELKNLIIEPTRDDQWYKIRRQNTEIQKDFFSATEYLIEGVNKHIELAYYNKKQKPKNNFSDIVLMGGFNDYSKKQKRKR